MFERFTERSRQVVTLAQIETKKTSCSNIGTEHILLGLIGEAEGNAARVLLRMNISANDVYKQIKNLHKEETTPPGQIPFTPHAKKIAQLYFAESRKAANKPLRFYHPPTFQARYNSLPKVVVLGDSHTGVKAAVMTFALVSGTALMIFGYWVLTVKA